MYRPWLVPKPCHNSRNQFNDQYSWEFTLCISGLRCSSLGANVARALHLSIDRSSAFEIRGLGAQVSPVLGSVSVEIQIAEEVVVKQEFVVVEDHFMTFCAILGADFLRDNNCTLDFAGKSFILGFGVQLPFQNPGSIRSTFLGPLQRVPRDIPSHVRSICVGKPSQWLRFGIEYNVEGLSKLTSLFSRENLLHMQKSSNVLRELGSWRSSNPKTWPNKISKFKKYANKIVKKDGVLVFDGSSGPVVIVDMDLLVEVVLVVHYKMAHIGRNKILDLLRTQVWNPNFNKVVCDVTSSCLICQRSKPSSIIYPPLNKIETSYPGEIFATDSLALPESSEGSVGLLVGIDHNSKWLCAVPIRNKKSATVAKAFERNILPSLAFRPSCVLSDNGPEFIG